MLAVSLCGLCGCGKGEGGKREEALLIGLNEARAWQRRADLHLQEGDVQAAIVDVRQVLAVNFPPEAPEAQDARLDARARLSQLLLRAAAASTMDAERVRAEEEALQEIAAARKEATRDSFFTANLESVQAEIYEARANRLKDPAAQKEARTQALKALERAIEIDRRLLRSLVQGHAGAGREGFR
jgi:tetratricopeptide (TPR) repeat protein